MTHRKFRRKLAEERKVRNAEDRRQTRQRTMQELYSHYRRGFAELLEERMNDPGRKA